MNRSFAKHCEGVLRSYGTGEDLSASLIQLLADARHWCDQACESFAALDRAAHRLYTAELQHERSTEQ